MEANSTALRTWLAQKVDVPYGHGPDHRASPHSALRQVDFESLFQIECMQIATSGDTMEVTREQALAVRVLAYALSCEHLDLLNGLLLCGSLPYNFPHHLWKQSVQNYLDGKPLIEVSSGQAYVDVTRILPPGRHRVLLIDKQGNALTDRAVTSLRYHNGEGVKLPVDLYIIHEAAMDRELPEDIKIDCTGLGGQTRLTGLRFKGEEECSHSSYDITLNMLEKNCLLYLGPEKFPTRRRELVQKKPTIKRYPLTNHSLLSKTSSWT